MTALARIFQSHREVLGVAFFAFVLDLCHLIPYCCATMAKEDITISQAETYNVILEIPVKRWLFDLGCVAQYYKNTRERLITQTDRIYAD
jgi:hypothetical protein